MADAFRIHTDRYNGVTVDASEQNFTSVTEFAEKLKAAIPEWRCKGKRGLWVKIDHKHAGLVPLLSQMELEFHHAQPGYVMMTLWISESQPNHLPEFANQYIGVAGFVVNEKNQLLVVQEKYGNRRSYWKLPGGHANKGEDLADTARREVLEETGIQCEFVSLIAFRHQHKYRFGCSDLYFVCLMHPVTQQIDHCPTEIAACRWMELDEYINDPEVSDANRYFAECYRDGLTREDLAVVPTKILSYDKRVLHNVYSIQTLAQKRPDQDLPKPASNM